MLALQAAGIWTHRKEEISKFQGEPPELKIFISHANKNVYLLEG